MGLWLEVKGDGLIFTVNHRNVAVLRLGVLGHCEQGDCITGKNEQVDGPGSPPCSGVSSDGIDFIPIVVLAGE